MALCWVSWPRGWITLKAPASHWESEVFHFSPDDDELYKSHGIRLQQDARIAVHRRSSQHSSSHLVWKLDFDGGFEQLCELEVSQLRILRSCVKVDAGWCVDTHRGRFVSPDHESEQKCGEGHRWSVVFWMRWWLVEVMVRRAWTPRWLSSPSTCCGRGSLWAHLIFSF